MKRTLIFAIAVVMIAGCTKNPGSDKPVNPGNPEGTVTFRALASQYSTRVAITDGDAGLTFEWLGEADKIGLFATDAMGKLKDNAKYKAVSAGSVSDFSPETADEAIVWGRLSHKFYAYHPYRTDVGTDIENVPVSLPAAQTQDGSNLAHIAPLNFIYAVNEGVTPVDGVVELAFNHIFSVLNIQLTATEGTATVNSLKFRGTAGDEELAFDKGTFDFLTGEYAVADDADVASEIALTFAQPAVVRSTRAYNAYILITPGHAGKTFKVVAVTDDGEEEVATVTVPAGGIPAGVKAIIPATVTGEVAEAVNLSADGTANTYIISREGDYKFDATIKGNGIARTYTLGGTKPMYSYDKTSLYVEPAKALVLWYNCEQTSTAWKNESPVAVSSVELKSDGYIYFSTPEDFVNGNVVIMVVDSDVNYETITATDGVIDNTNVLWSWNIWASKDYNPETDPNNISVDQYTIMGRNLGAIADIADVTPWGDANHVKAAGLVGNYYQWGRKDPFPYFASFSASNGAVDGSRYTPTYTPITALQNTVGSLDGQMFASADTDMIPTTGLNTLEKSLACALQSPHRYLNHAGNYAWYATPNEQYKSLWGAPRAENTTGAPDDINDGLKSVFDPCPVGWKVWNNGAFAEVTYSGATVPTGTEYGVSPNAGGFFPISGRRDGTGSYAESLPQNKTNGAAFATIFWTANSNQYSGYWGYSYIWKTKWVDGAMAVDYFDVGEIAKPRHLINSMVVRCIKDTEVAPEPDPIEIVGDSEGSTDQVAKMNNWTGWN